MSKGAWIRFLLVIGLLIGCAAIAITQKPTLGLDLQGGISITLQAQDGKDGTKANAENTDKAIEVIRRRVDGLGVSEPVVVRSGENRIIVELAGYKDKAKAAEQVGKTAQLTIQQVTEEISEAEAETRLAEEAKKAEAERVDILRSESNPSQFLVLGPIALTGSDIKGASAEVESTGGRFVVRVQFSDTGAPKFKALSADAACKPNTPENRIAIVLDGAIISDPGVSVPCGQSMSSETTISGDFTQQETKDLSVLIDGGALPLPVDTIETRVLGPSLGKAAISASINAGIIGIALTGLFIVAVYRFVGLMATIALASYALLSYALLIAMGSTLTLPGLAGFVLAIGMAIDANVLVFERAREEYAAKPSMGLRNALMVGFNKAWTAIIDSNVTTLLAAGLLFFLGSGPIKGFGVTLTIGVIASMISALIIARVLTEVGVGSKFLSSRPNATGIGDIGRVRAWLEKKNPDIMGRRKPLLGISAAATLIAVLGIFVNPLNLGVEFTGGRVLEYSTTTKVTADQTRDALSEIGFADATVQETSEDKIQIRTSKISDEEQQTIQDAVATIGGGAQQERDETVSASFGKELRDKAIIAFGIAFLAQLLYLAIRFKWTFGLSAVIAMVHDVVIVVGLFAWLGKPIDGVFLAAAMTIIGLSVNDTVVVFDRVREKWRGSAAGASFTSVANRAAVETLPRTVNTGLGTMFILAALAVLGGDSLQDFAIALLVGLLVGTYSSVCTATPMLTYFHQKWPMSKEAKRRETFERDASGAVV